MAKIITCKGCLEEISYGLDLLEEGLTVGLEDNGKHCFMFAFDKKGNLVIE